MTEHEFQLHSPTEPEFQLVQPPVEAMPATEATRERQLDFSGLFGTVALFAENHHGHFELEEREAA